MPLGNWVMLEEGIPERVHFVDHVLTVRDVTDRATGRTVTRNVAVMDVDELNGKPVTAQLSVMSEKLYAQLEPYIRDNSYKDYDFTLTKVGTGFRTEYSVQHTPRA